MPHIFQIFTVEYFESDDGSYPVETFILTQNPKMQAKIFRSLMLLEQFGNQLREPYSKHLRDGIYELRTRQGSDITRVLYFFFVDRRKLVNCLDGMTNRIDPIPFAIIRLFAHML